MTSRAAAAEPVVPDQHPGGAREKPSRRNDDDNAYQATGFARRARAWVGGLAVDGLSPAARVALMALADAADQTGEISWSKAATVHVTGLPERTAHRAIRALTEHCLIYPGERITGPKARYRANTTRLLDWETQLNDHRQSVRLELAWLLGRMPGLSARDRLVYIALNAFCVDWDTGETRVTDAFIAKQSGVSVRHLQGKNGALNRLAEAGLIARSGNTHHRQLWSFAMPEDPDTDAKLMRSLWKQTRMLPDDMAVVTCRNGSNWLTMWQHLADDMAVVTCRNGSRTLFLDSFLPSIQKINSERAAPPFVPQGADKQRSRLDHSTPSELVLDASN